jgi:XapX domain-containing protein
MSAFKIVIGILLGICIGIGCRLFDIPLPGPPAILGAVLAVAMATGYTLTDRLLAKRAAVARELGSSSVGVVASADPGERRP